MCSKIFLKTGSVTTALKGMKFYEVSQTAEDLITYIKQKDSYCMQSHGHKRAFASLLILLFVYLKCYQRRLPGQCSDPSEDAAASAGMALCCTMLAGTQLLTAVSHQLPEPLVPKVVWNVRGHKVHHTLERRSSQLSFLHKGK